MAAPQAPLLDTVQVPPQVILETHFTWLLNELEPQEAYFTAFSPGSGWPTNPEDEPITPDKAAGKERVRILGCHFGYLPHGYSYTISGATGTTEALNYTSKYYTELQSEYITERYGNASWIQDFVRGKVCTTDVEHLLRDWSLTARLYELPVVGELPGDAVTRLANRARYLQGIADLTNLWYAAYNEAHNDAVNKLAFATGEQRTWLQRAIKVYDEKHDRVRVFVVEGVLDHEL